MPNQSDSGGISPKGFESASHGTECYSFISALAYGARIVVAFLLLVTRLAHGDALAPGRDRALFELHHALSDRQ